MGITTAEHDFSADSEIKCGQAYGFGTPLELKENEAIAMNEELNDEIQLIVGTNLFDIECTLKVPIYLFFDPKEAMNKKEFMTIWKSLSAEKECKLAIAQCKYENMEKLKEFLLTGIYELYFIHHRSVSGKGNVLYYCCRIKGAAILIEIAIHISEKGTVITRSDDVHKSMLCAKAILLLIT